MLRTSVPAALRDVPPLLVMDLYDLQVIMAHKDSTGIASAARNMRHHLVLQCADVPCGTLSTV